MKRLIRLYPARWRKRYGAELEQLVSDLRPSRSTVALAADLVKGAVNAHVQQGIGMNEKDWRAVRRGTLIAGVVWVGLSAEIVVSNVIMPPTSDDDASAVLLSYLAVLAALFLTGMLAARDGAGRRGQVLAGAAAGALIGALTAVTFAVVDNVWLGVVARQPSKIEGFAHSDASSMRAFINNGLIGVAVFFTLGFGLAGAMFGRAGGLVIGPAGLLRRRR